MWFSNAFGIRLTDERTLWDMILGCFRFLGIVRKSKTIPRSSAGFVFDEICFHPKNIRPVKQQKLCQDCKLHPIETSSAGEKVCLKMVKEIFEKEISSTSSRSSEHPRGPILSYLFGLKTTKINHQNHQKPPQNH